MRDDLDMSGNNINMNGGAINGLAFDTLTLQNNTTIDDASGALVTSNLKGSLAYATITPADKIGKLLLTEKSNQFFFIEVEIIKIII